MTKFAYYDSTILPNDQVIGWIDSDIEKNIPPAADLLELTDAQWQARASDIFYVVSGILTGSKNILSIVQATQLQILSSACATQILSGFSSSALSAAYTYASTDVDQRNIVQSAQSTKGGLLSCQNATGVWQRVAHSQAQAQNVLEDFVAFRDAARTMLGTLAAQVNAATSVEQVQALVWESSP